jgi:hypothetical protein
LLVLFTAVAVFLGYTQWRRRFVVEQCDAMARLGARVYLVDSWWWPTVMSVEVKNTPPKYAEIEERAKSVGIERVSQLLGDLIFYPGETRSDDDGKGKVIRVGEILVNGK